jgi:CheY-like chemotaxis protein
VAKHLLNSIRVLLAEDGVDNQRLIRFLLERAGAAVTLAENGQLAIEHVYQAQESGEPFDCILMDMQMPVLDGYDTTRYLRATGCATPIIALTAHAMTGDKQRCLRAGCNNYLSKPVAEDDLLQMISRHVSDPSDAMTHA